MKFSISNDWSIGQQFKVLPELEITLETIQEVTTLRVLRLGWLTHSIWIERK